MAQISSATAVWNGTLKEGAGELSLPKASATFSYDFGSRFETGNTTNPEELIGGALSACFSMYLSALFSKEGLQNTQVESTAEVHLDGTQSPPKITTILLDVKATAQGLSKDQFDSLLKQTENECPVKNLYQGANISIRKAELN